MKKIFIILLLSLFILSCSENKNKLNEIECFKYSKDFYYNKNESYIKQIFYSKKYDTCFIELSEKGNPEIYLYNLFTKELIQTKTNGLESQEYYGKILREIQGENYYIKISNNIK